MNFFNMATRVGAFIGVLVLVFGLASSKGSPQEAAVAAIAVALAVLPYVWFRVLQISADAAENRVRYMAVLKRLDNLLEAQEATADTHVKCPDCRELVLKDARKCKHCDCALVPQ